MGKIGFRVNCVNEPCGTCEWTNTCKIKSNLTNKTKPLCGMEEASGCRLFSTDCETICYMEVDLPLIKENQR